MTLIQQAEKALAEAQADYHSKATAARAARAKVEAAARRLAELQFKALEVDMDIVRQSRTLEALDRI